MQEVVGASPSYRISLVCCVRTRDRQKQDKTQSEQFVPSIRYFSRILFLFDLFMHHGAKKAAKTSPQVASLCSIIACNDEKQNCITPCAAITDGAQNRLDLSNRVNSIFSLRVPQASQQSHNSYLHSLSSGFGFSRGLLRSICIFVETPKIG